MNFSLFYLSPELILALGGIVALFVGLASKSRKGFPWPEVFCLLVLAAALVPTIAMLTMGRVTSGTSIFGGIFAVDGLAMFFKIVALISTGIVTLISTDFFRRIRFHRGEYYALLIFATLAITTLAASADLIMIYLTLEFLSLTSYILAGYLKQDTKSNEAAVKYFLYGSIASAVMIYGMSLIYGLTGTTNIVEIASTFKVNPASYPLLYLAVVMLLAGFGYKIAMVPFHQWSPDVYEGAPTPVTAFLSVGSKAAGFAVLIRVFATGISTAVLDWAGLIMVLSAVTMTVGNLVAIPQTNIKRMLAYSSIGQAGYLLLGVAAMAYSSIALPSVLLYIFAYTFTNLGAFAVVSMISTRIKSDYIRDYAGLIRRAPAAAVAMVFFMLSLAGIPPTAGFLGKFYIFAAAIQSGNSWLLALTIVAIINTIISVYYYMNVVRYMFFVKAKRIEPIEQPGIMNFVIGMTFAMTIIILVYAGPFISMAHISSGMFKGI